MCCNRGPSSQSGTLLGSSRRYIFRSLEGAGFIWTENRLALFGDISFPLQCPSQNQRGLARRLQVTAFGLIYVEESARSKNEAFGTLSLKEQMKKIRKDWHVLAEDKNATLPANCKDFAGFDIQVTIPGQRSFPQLYQRVCRSRILWRKKRMTCSHNWCRLAAVVSGYHSGVPS